MEQVRCYVVIYFTVNEIYNSAPKHPAKGLVCSDDANEPPPHPFHHIWL